MSDQTNYDKLDELWPNRTFAQKGKRNPDGKWHYNRQRKLPDRTTSKTVNKVVLHTSEQKPDPIPPDDGAEWLVAYQLSTKRSASWHVSVDSGEGDGSAVQWALPESYRAWHCHDISQSALGIEMCNKAHLWGKMEPEWELNLLAHSAIVVSFWCAGLDIPTNYISGTDARNGGAGITAHGWVDPGRRSDPGVSGTATWTTFPHHLFLELVRDYYEVWDGKGKHPGRPDSSTYVKQLAYVRHSKKAVAPKKKKVPQTEAQKIAAVTDSFLRRYASSRELRGSRNDIRLVQALVGSAQDGYYGPNTQGAIDRYLKGGAK